MAARKNGVLWLPKDSWQYHLLKGVNLDDLRRSTVNRISASASFNIHLLSAAIVIISVGVIGLVNDWGWKVVEWPAGRSQGSEGSYDGRFGSREET